MCQMSWNVFAVQSCTFLAVSILTFLVFRAIWSLDKRLRNRLQDLPGRRQRIALPQVARQTPKSTQSVRARLVALAARVTPNDQREGAQISIRLMHAGIYAPWAPSVLVCVKLMMIVTPPIIGFALGQTRILNPNVALFYGATAGGFGIIVPSLWLDRRKAKRHAVL